MSILHIGLKGILGKEDVFVSIMKRNGHKYTYEPMKENIKYELMCSITSFTGNCGLCIFYHPKYKYTKYEGSMSSFIYRSDVSIRYPEIRNILYKEFFLYMLSRLITRGVQGFVISDRILDEKQEKDHIKRLPKGHDIITMKGLMERYNQYINVQSKGNNNNSPYRIMVGSYIAESYDEINELIKTVSEEPVEGIKQDEVIEELGKYFSLKYVNNQNLPENEIKVNEIGEDINEVVPNEVMTNE